MDSARQSKLNAALGRLPEHQQSALLERFITETEGETSEIELRRSKGEMVRKALDTDFDRASSIIVDYASSTLIRELETIADSGKEDPPPVEAAE